MASSALSSSWAHALSPNLTKPSTPVVRSPDTSGAAASVLTGTPPESSIRRWNSSVAGSGRITMGVLAVSEMANTGSASAK